jgi:hypothetical protein
MKNMNDERIDINATGTCITFEPGVSEWYEAEREAEKEAGADE